MFDYKKAVIHFLFIFTVSNIIFSQDFLTIYNDNQEKYFGRSLKRTGITGINLMDFKDYKTKAVGDRNGNLTAVLVSSYINASLEMLLEKRDKIQYEDTSITVLKKVNRRNIYLYNNSKYGISFSFSLEKADKNIYSQIEMVYGNNIYWHKIVTKLYVNNYVVRIYSAENIKGFNESKITYSEIMFMATLLGERDQPLWGIHDGLGILENIAYALKREDVVNRSKYNAYRKPVRNEDLLFTYINKIETMGSDFINNLHAFSSINIFTTEVTRDLQFPEVLVKTEYGSQYDKVLLYYDILTRKHYTCRLILVRAAYTQNEPVLIVVFKDPDTYKWGVIGDMKTEVDLDSYWKNAVVNFYNHDMNYIEIDINDLFRNKKYPDVNSILWNLLLHTEKYYKD